MRIIDVHCHPGTERWHQTMAPYLGALRSYWGQEWPVKTEQEMIADFERNGIEPVIVALDVARTAHTPPTDNDYVAALRDRHGCIAQAWGTVDPHRGRAAIEQAEYAIKTLKLLGLHFHPIAGGYTVSDPAYYPLWEALADWGAPICVDIGMTGVGGRMPGGHGLKLRHAHPLAVDEIAADFPRLTIVMAHPGFPWIDEATAVCLHKGNVFWEMSGWGVKHIPEQIKRDIRGRLKDKIMFGSDYPSLSYERLIKEWLDVGYPDDILERFFHGNAERILGL
ncbi:MAG: amidohydrolase family protein [Rhodoplanes sp.]